MARFLWLEGRTPYREAYELQKRLLHARIADEIGDVVLLLEHEPVITLGRKRGAAGNVLRPEGVPVVEVERGGDVTWHGPGQLVAYPIVKLEGRRADLHLHLRSLEEAVIALLTELGLEPGRDPRNTGVWLPDPSGTTRKVCSVGVACKRWVTWHGLALNVSVEPGAFSRIRPCGFEAGVMTSLREHLGDEAVAGHASLQALVPGLATHLARCLELSLDGIERVSDPAHLELA